MRALLFPSLLSAALLAAAPAPAQPVAVPGAGSAAAPPETLVGTTPASAADRQFLETALASGMTEAALGELGKVRAQDPALRVFGRWMTADHVLADNMLREAGGRLGVTLPEALDPARRAELDGMTRLPESQFDAAFLDRMTADHRAAVALYTDRRDRADNPGIRALAASILPLLQQHLDALQELNATPRVAVRTLRAPEPGLAGTGSSQPAP